MVIFLADGRLGNQVFQYVFIKTIAENHEKILVSGFDDLVETFDIDNVVNFKTNNRWARAFVSRVCRPVLSFLSGNKIISSITVDYEDVPGGYTRESTTFKLTQGLIRKITFLKLGFFQSERFFDSEVVEHLKLKSSHIENAMKALKSVPDGYHKIFVHVRRGDYVSYRVYGQSTLLPISYFKEQVDWFLNNKRNCYFIFLSDQPDLIEKEFGYIENKLISGNNHYSIDFSIMTQCNSAILSPSSFGWWGSYMMHERDTVIVPKYWLGFCSKIEFQSHCVPEYSLEVEVEI